MDNKKLKELSYKHGKLWYYENDQIACNILRHPKKTYQEYIVTTLQKYTKPGATVLDVGANMGVFTVAMSKYVGDKGKVYAFEPVTHTYNLLMKNVELNNLKNVECMKLALSDANETRVIHNYSRKDNFSLGHSTLLTETKATALFSEEIKLIPLDDLHLNDIAFIKVDIEKHEPYFVKGALQTLQRCEPALILELPIRDEFEKAKFNECCTLLQPINYKYVEHLSEKDALFLPASKITAKVPEKKKSKAQVPEKKKAKAQSKSKLPIGKPISLKKLKLKKKLIKSLHGTK